MTGHDEHQPVGGDSDLELLRAYARESSDAAFRHLVDRHVNLVYSAALRQVRGDRHHAEDVTQAVFIVLARKAASLGSGVVLAGWLLNAARFCSRDLLKREGRRKRHEQAAARQRTHDMSSSPHPNLSPADAAAANAASAPSSDAAERAEADEQIALILDDALAALGASGRDAVVLRFLEQRSFREVGDRLGISEQAAKQRVFRAVQKLRAILDRRGVRMSAEGLVTFLATQTVHAAPPGLAAAVSATALKTVAMTGAAAAATAGAASSPAAIAKGAVILMTWTHAKVAAIAALILLFMGGAAAGIHHWSRSRDDVVIPVQAKAAGGTDVLFRPAPVASPYITPTAQPFAGRAPITGTVHNADGSPAANAEVLLGNSANNVWIYEKGTNNAEVTHTNAAGHFSITPRNQPTGLVVRADGGYAIEALRDLTKPVDLTLKPWGRIEGTVRVGTKPVPRARVYLVHYTGPADPPAPVVYQHEYTADAEGNFVIEHVVPGDSQISRMNDQVGWVGFMPIQIKAGETTQVQIGGTGRPLVGKVTPMKGEYNFRRGTLMQNNPHWKAGDPQPLQLSFDAKTDGSFRVEDVPPGTYSLQMQIGVIEPNSYYVESAADAYTNVTVAEIPGGRSDDPQDVGTLTIKERPRLLRGQVVPDFTVTSPDGKPVKLSDFRGKFVLLHFWSGNRYNSMEDSTAPLRAVYDRYGDDPRFVMLSVRVDGPVGQAAQATGALHTFLKSVGVNTGGIEGRSDPLADAATFTWSQAGVPVGMNPGDPKSPIPPEYFASPSWLTVIGPDGKLLAKNFNGIGAFSIVSQVLSDKSPATGQTAARVESEVQPRAQANREPWSLQHIPLPPSADNLATRATFTIVDGAAAANQGTGGLTALHDGKLPPKEDVPGQCFFFDWGTIEGRVRVDLDRVTRVGEVHTFSWHKESRGPQVYRLYASDGTAANFNPAPKLGVDPATCGWTKVATVDTRPHGADGLPVRGAKMGGRYAVNVHDPDTGELGRYRYLLFEMFVTETEDQWGHTFYGEIEVTEKK